MNDIKTSLIEIGLSGKEVDVYLAMLELGPASVQDIAKKAGINRTTTYVMLEGLERHGLMSSFEQGKKTMFIAENPQRLLSIVSDQVSKIEDKRTRLEDFMPRLLAIFNAIEDKPKVRFFEGEEGLNVIREEMSGLRDEMSELVSVDEFTLQVASVGEKKRIELSKRAHGRLLYAIKPGLKPPTHAAKELEMREIEYGRFPFSGSMAIVGNRIYIVTTKSKGLGIIIESREVADMLKALYNFVWETAKPYPSKNS